MIAVLPDGSRHELKIEEHWFQQNRLVLKFATSIRSMRLEP